MGIKGVSKGDERAIGETVGVTAGIILGEDTTVPLLMASNLGSSGDERNRLGELGEFGTRTSRLEARLLFSCDTPSCECLRCSSRIKPMNKFLKTHLPTFTVVKKNMHDKSKKQMG